MKTYAVKEIYYTLQGEGFHTGRPAVFCRFSGCNLWSGREEDRHKAICQFCDTNFWGTDGENGGKYTAEKLTRKIIEQWPLDSTPFIVFTGGEPALQLDSELINELKTIEAETAIETNGTIELPEGIDWICMSPKANTEIVVRTGNELKLVYPQEGMDPKDFETWNFDYHFLQPMDNAEQDANTLICIDYCKNNPKWRLSMQTHKYLNIP
ncbi:MAG: 7-carboxy-7-deazaguanine synthase [Saprospiraceae bacterium]|nr:7-carboxy-7-deazaguanine synthase [Saprospiraceae bacterium]